MRAMWLQREAQHQKRQKSLVHHVMLRFLYLAAERTKAGFL